MPYFVNALLSGFFNNLLTALINGIMISLISILLLLQTNPSGVTPLPEVVDPLKVWVQVGTIVGAILTLLTFILTRNRPWIQAKLDRRSIQKRVGAESYTSASLENSFRYFVPPICQDVDPSGGEEPRAVYGVKQKLFDALDDALSQPETYKYLILLADSGMGKSTALLNYYLRYIRMWRKPLYNLVLIPLNTPDADRRIESISNPEDTVLFLDALDEDTLAIVDYVERLRMLLRATNNFRCVLISCRTQFFSKDEEIPKETGRIRVADRRAGQEAEYYFQKIYLSPFSDAQVKKYLRLRYPFWRSERRQAFRMVRKIPHLTARPMLLAHVDDLLKAKRDFLYSHELYEEMIEAWLRREKGFVQEKESLREFSEMLAVDLYLHRAERKSERIPKFELQELAKSWRIILDEWKLSGRSLLNRDAEGNFKFAHRSIMEYLFVKRFSDGDERTSELEWTDQMYIFLWEMLIKRFRLSFVRDSNSATLSSVWTINWVGKNERRILFNTLLIALEKNVIRSSNVDRDALVAYLCAVVLGRDIKYPSAYVIKFKAHTPVSAQTGFEYTTSTACGSNGIFTQYYSLSPREKVRAFPRMDLIFDLGELGQFVEYDIPEGIAYTHASTRYFKGTRIPSDILFGVAPRSIPGDLIEFVLLIYSHIYGAGMKHA